MKIVSKSFELVILHECNKKKILRLKVFFFLLVVAKLMEDHQQEPLAGLKLKDWIVEAGMKHIVTEETRIDLGK